MCSCVRVTPRHLWTATERLAERDVALDVRLHGLEGCDLRVEDELHGLFGDQLLHVPVDLLTILAIYCGAALVQQCVQLLTLDPGAGRRAGRVHRLKVVAVGIDVRRVPHHHRVVVDLQEVVDPGGLFLLDDLELDARALQL